MMQAHGWTQEQLAEIVGKARPTVTNTLKLNALADSIKAECSRRSDISKSLLFEIARQETHKEQEQLWAKLRAGGTVRAARASSARRAPAGPAADPAAAVAATGRRLLQQIVALDSGLRPSEKSLRHDLTTLRSQLEIVIGKLARLPVARAAE
jgi:ParB-like chromosome segregation protein Spo0J